eukprot:3418002-Alexandrium_andersonii.AAC.1
MGLISVPRGWAHTPMSEAHWSLYAQLRHFAQVHLMLNNVTALKAGRGCANIPVVTGHSSALLM